MKILQAETEKSEVKTKDGIAIPECQILSAGVKKSDGIVILSEFEKVYIAIPIESLKSILDLITNLTDLTNNLMSKLSADIMPANQGGPIAPNLSADIAVLQNQIAQYKQNISELKDNLQ